MSQHVFWKKDRSWWECRAEARQWLEAIWWRELGRFPTQQAAERLLWMRWMVESGRLGHAAHPEQPTPLATPLRG